MTTGENPIPERLPAAGTAGCGRARSSTRNITRFKQTIPDAEGEPGSIGFRNLGIAFLIRGFWMRKRLIYELKPAAHGEREFSMANGSRMAFGLRDDGCVSEILQSLPCGPDVLQDRSGVGECAFQTLT